MIEALIITTLVIPWTVTLGLVILSIFSLISGLTLALPLRSRLTNLPLIAPVLISSGRYQICRCCDIIWISPIDATNTSWTIVKCMHFLYYNAWRSITLLWRVGPTISHTINVNTTNIYMLHVLNNQTIYLHSQNDKLLLKLVVVLKFGFISWLSVQCLFSSIKLFVKVHAWVFFLIQISTLCHIVNGLFYKHCPGQCKNMRSN